MESDKNFWDFSPWEKHDVIKEGQHDHLFLGALADQETSVEKLDRKTYILYGNKEALLMKPVGFIYRISLDLLEAFLSLRNYE